MKFRLKLHTILGIYGLLICISGQAQSLENRVIASTGEVFSNQNSETLSWTLGEVVIEIYNNNTSKLTQGFHQGGLEEESNANSGDQSLIDFFQLSPNPNRGIFKIEIQAKFSSKIELQVFNPLGQIIQKGIALNLLKGQNIFEIKLNSLASGLYLISFTQQGKRINLTEQFKQGYLQGRSLKANPFIKFIVL